MRGLPLALICRSAPQYPPTQHQTGPFRRAPAVDKAKARPDNNKTKISRIPQFPSPSATPKLRLLKVAEHSTRFRWKPNSPVVSGGAPAVSRERCDRAKFSAHKIQSNFVCQKLAPRCSTQSIFRSRQSSSGPQTQISSE